MLSSCYPQKRSHQSDSSVTGVRATMTESGESEILYFDHPSRNDRGGVLPTLLDGFGAGSVPGNQGGTHGRYRVRVLFLSDL